MDHGAMASASAQDLSNVPAQSTGSQSDSPRPDSSNSNKRSSSQAGNDDDKKGPPKKRAAKACRACRSRKVRCDVMHKYHFTPDGNVTCSNCTMDGIPCVVEESKRRKKQISNGQIDPSLSQSAGPDPFASATAARALGMANGIMNPSDINNRNDRRWSGSDVSNDGPTNGHMPHSIYRNAQINNGEMLRRASYIRGQFEVDNNLVNNLLKSASVTGDRTSNRPISPPPIYGSPGTIPQNSRPKHLLPAYLKPLPTRMTSVDIEYLYAKGALSLPETSVRNALVTAYLEYVHPYMPLIEVCETLRIIDDESGASGKMSLFLFQAMMFAGTAFVDMDVLKRAGFTNRKAARKAFFQKARVLYDFDYEVDRISLVQSLLLMTYWYETPDDQKDTWHWMGVAISLAHTIGLHRDPANSNMEPHLKRLWKRIWWSTFMRDRLVALGMRRPTRVKEEDYDVPMLTEEDFETELPPVTNRVVSIEHTLIRDVAAQKELAQLCIAKAKLCLCVSHVLGAQYSVLVKHQGMQGQEGTTRSSVMLFPKKLDQTDEVRRCDLELSEWLAELPPACIYSEELATGASAPPLFVQRSLLHMIYFTALSALHRPQVLPNAPTDSSSLSQLTQDNSRKRVREASKEITRISKQLHVSGLDRYLPTTGVTVLLPAIIIHLLDVKSPNEEARKTAMQGFNQCMQLLERLRENYSSADFATQFLEAAVKMANIDMPSMPRAQDKPIPTAESAEDVLLTEKINHLKGFVEGNRRTPPSASTDIPPIPQPATHKSNAISALTPPNHQDTPHLLPTNNMTFPSIESEKTSDLNLLSNLQFDGNNGTYEQDIFFNFDAADTFMGDGVFGGESGLDLSFMGGKEGWSRVGSPSLFGGEQYLDVNAGGVGLGEGFV